MWTYFRAIDGKGYWGKPKIGMVFIEAPVNEALKVFEERFGFKPEIGSIEHSNANYLCFPGFLSLKAATSSARGDIGTFPNTASAGPVPVDEYIKNPWVTVIRKEELACKKCFGCNEEICLCDHCRPKEQSK